MQPNWTTILCDAERTPDSADWAQFDREPRPVRAAAVDALKAAVDRAVREAPPRALPLSERLVRAAQGIEERAALAHRGRAVALHANGQSAAAREPYETALAHYERDGDALEAARVRRSLVDVYQMAGDSGRAIAAAELARATFERLGEGRLLAQLECNVGNVHFRLDRFAEAAAHYERAVEVFEREGDPFGRAFALYNLGNVRTNGGEFEAARRDFAEARARFLEGGHRVYAADAAYGAAYLEFRAGNPAAALVGLEAVRNEYAQGGKPQGVPLCDLDIAELHLSLGAWRDASRRADAAEAAFRALGMAYEEAKAALFGAIALGALGEVAGAGARFDRAETLLAGLGNRVKGALVLLQRVHLERSPERLAELLPRVELAARELASSGDEWLSRTGQLALAELCAATGHTARARQLLETLLAAPTAAATRALEIDARGALAALLHGAGEGERAREELERAVEAVEATYTRLAARDARLAFFRDRQVLYARLAALDVERGDGALALERLESSRQRSLRERPELPGLEDRDLLALRERIDFHVARRAEARGARVEGASGGAAGPERGAALAEAGALAALETELMDRVRGRRARATAAPERRVDLESLLGRALAPDERLLYYVDGGRDLYAVCIGPQSGGRDMHCVRLSANALDFEHWLDRWRFLIHKARLGRAYCERHGAALSRGMGELLAELGERALAPIGDHLAGDGGPLVIVPYGVLHGLPLHAARLRGQSLAVERPVSYGRSLLQLARCKEAAAASDRVLVAGGGGRDLPAVERELEGVLVCHGGRGQRVAARELESALSEGQRAPGVLHLASHGAFRPDHPLFSGLELEGRYLAALDIPRLEVAGSMAVLSGCETARHVVSLGEELFGPEQSFLAAGARAVVASLWPVSDDESAAFMGQLHGSLAQGAPLVEALRAAQAPALDALRFPPTAAAFVVVGDARARLSLGAADEEAPARIE